MTQTAPQPELQEIRDAHKIDAGNLERFMSENVEDFKGPLTVHQFAGGQSNPTYLLETPSRRYVMRKKPPGELLKSAHQVDREFRVMKALAQTDVPVPRMYALCEDDAVIGTAFYIMEFLEGRIFRDPQLPGMAPEERAAIYDSMNDVLARLHNVDHEAIGLGDYGRPGNYFERQIGRWIKQFRAAETHRVDAMEELIAYLPENIPAEDSVSIAHGDYRLENSIFHPTEPRMIAVLDWELSTIGHPLADLGYNCLLYHMDSPSQGTLMGLDSKATGIPTEEDYVAAYCRRTGREGIENWNFYVGFSLFRLAAISQGVYKRGLDGISSNEKAKTYKDVSTQLANKAWEIIQAGA